MKIGIAAWHLNVAQEFVRVFHKEILKNFRIKFFEDVAKTRTMKFLGNYITSNVKSQCVDNAIEELKKEGLYSKYAETFKILGST